MAQYSVDIVARALGGSAIDKLKQQFDGVDQAARKAQSGLDQTANNIRGFGSAAANAGSAAKGFGESVNGLAGRLASFAAQLGLTIGAITTLKSSLDAAFSREASESRLQALTSSAKEYELALGAAEIASRRFGITQTEANNALGDMYGRLKGLGFGLAQVNDIYTGFNVIARESRTSADDAAGAFLQLSQAMGSGKLQGDELRSILERMPQLAQAIAQEMGVSAGAIRQMAADGKIGVEQLANTLYGAAGRADELGNTFTKQQATMADVARKWEEVRVAIGQTLAPTYVAALQALSDAAFFFGEAMKGAAVWVEKNRSAIEAVVAAGVQIGLIVGSVWAVVAAYQAWQKVTVALATAKAFLVSLTGKGLLLVAAGAAAAAGAYALLNKGVDDVGKSIQRMKDESEKAYQTRKASILAELKAQKEIEDQLTKQRQAEEDLVQTKKELEAAQKKVTAAIQDSADAADQLATQQTSALENRNSGVQAYLRAEMQVNDVLLQQAQRQLDGARNAQQRYEAAKRIYDLTIANAQLEYQATLAQIDQEVEKSRILASTAQIKLKELEATVQLAAAQGVANSEHWKALSAAREAANLAEGNYQTTVKIAEEQRRAAKAIYDGKVAAAGAAFEQNKVFQATKGAADEAGRFAGNMESAASSAERAAKAMGQASGDGASGNTTDSMFGAAAKNSEFMESWSQALKKNNEMFVSVSESQRRYSEILNRYLKMAEEYNRKISSEKRQSDSDAWNKVMGAGMLPRYAKGGYVNSPQVAMVGEGGEPEYIIPKSRMDDALSNYAAGKRGSAVLSTPSQINLTYSGNIIRQDQSDYLSTSAVPGIVRQAVDQTISHLGRDPGARRSAGIA